MSGSGEYFELLPSPPHPLPDFATWQSVESHHRSPPLPPKFLLGQVPPDLLRAYFSHVHNSDAGVFRLHSCSVTERGFIRHAGLPVACNYISMSWPLMQQLQAGGTVRDEGPYRSLHITQAVQLFAVGYDVYGHWLVDFLPKFHILQKLGYDITKLTYLCPRDLPTFGLAWLVAIGIRPEQMFVYDPHQDIVQVDDLILPTMARSAHRAMAVFSDCADSIVRLIEHEHGASLPNDLPERIYISRDRAGRNGRMLSNRAQIEAMAEAAGFSLIYPEQMKLLDQVAHFRAARQIIGEYGSALHATMFSAVGADVLCLRGASYHPGFLQSGLCQARGQSCAYIMGEAPLEAINYEFEIDPDDFRLGLELLACN